MNKKWIVLPLMLVCLTSCKAQPASSESSAPPVNQTSASASLSENAAASTVSEKQLDQVIKQVCKELNDPGFQLEVELSDGKSIGKTGSIELGQGISQLFETCPYEDIEQMDIDSLSNEMVDNRIQFQIIGSEHWTQVICYTLSADYGDKAGKIYVEFIPSTQEYMGLKGYDMADASAFLFNEQLYPQIDALIQKMV